jgi:uncharacterized protein (TIGR02996 family)
VEESQLIAAVLSDSGADAPRERYREWLAANGQADRAELIRLQLEDAKQGPEEPDDTPSDEWEKRQEREVELIKAHPEWRTFPEIAGVQWGIGSNFGFERGFLESIGITGSQPFLTQMERIFTLAPIGNVVFSQVDDAGAKTIAGSPLVSRLRGLSLAHCRVGDAAAIAIAQSPHVHNLRRLRFYRSDLGPEGAAALAASRKLSDALTIDVKYTRIGAGGLTALRTRFGKQCLAEDPENDPERFGDDFDSKLVQHFQRVTGAMAAAAPSQSPRIELTIFPDGYTLEMRGMEGAKGWPASPVPVRQAAADLITLCRREGGGFTGFRFEMTRLPDGGWKNHIVRLEQKGTPAKAPWWKFW